MASRFAFLRPFLHVGSQWFQRALVVDPRYVMSFAEQLEADGFSTEL